MKKVYFVNVRDSRIIEGDLIESDQAKPLKRIETADGLMHIVPTTKLWDSKEELLINEFVTHTKTVGVENLIIKFNLDSEEGKMYLDKAIQKSPEKFI